MTYKISITDDAKGIVTDFWGDLSKEDLLSSTKEKLGIPHLEPLLYVLNDYSRVEKVTLNTEHLRENAQISVLAAEGNLRLFHATVMPSDLLTGFARLWAGNAGSTGWELHTYKKRIDAETAICKEFDTDFLFR